MRRDRGNSSTSATHDESQQRPQVMTSQLGTRQGRAQAIGAARWRCRGTGPSPTPDQWKGESVRILSTHRGFPWRSAIASEDKDAIQLISKDTTCPAAPRWQDPENRRRESPRTPRSRPRRYEHRSETDGAGLSHGLPNGILANPVFHEVDTVDQVPHPDPGPAMKADREVAVRSAPAPRAPAGITRSEKRSAP